MNTRVQTWGMVGVLLVLFLLSLGYFAYMNFLSEMTLPDVLVSMLLLAVPLVLLYFCTGLVIMACQQHRRQGTVSGWIATLVYRTPRTAEIAIVLFIGMFSLDVFGMPGSLLETILGFLVHSLPSIVLLLLLILAWRREWIGAVVFGFAALFFLRISASERAFDFGHVLLFSLPMTMIAVLFWLNWRWRGELRKPKRPAGFPRAGMHPS